MPLALVLPLPASVAVRLALPADVPGALPAEDLHLTLAVLVDGTAPPLDEARALAAELAPVVATVSGLGRFSGDEADAFHATVDGPTLPALRARVEALLASRLDATHGFDPHVTLAYLAADAPAPLGRLAPLPVTFDALALWDGATRTTFPLTAPTMTTATLDAIALPRDPPTELRLFRDGWNATVKGRFLLDAQGAAEILRRFAEHGVELAMDFDHATFAGAPGTKRDVPGYIAGLDYRPGDGLYATGLRWTAVGLAAITPGRAPDGTPTVPEYRYLSPAVDFDADILRFVLLPSLSADLLVNPDDVQSPLVPGAIDETEAVTLEDRAEDAMTEGLITTTPRHVTEVDVTVDRTNNILTTREVRVDFAITPKSYAKKITGTLGFRNPARIVAAG